MSESSQFEVIRVYDPAIDSSKSDAVEFAVSRDPKHLAFRQGMEPVKFVCQPLSHKMFLDYVSKGTTDEEKTYRSFAACVKRVNNYGDRGNWVPERDDARLLSDRDMEAFAIADILEVGNVCFQKSMLPKAPPPRYQLAPTSVRAWESKAAAESLSVAQSQSDAHKTSEKQEVP